MYNHCFLDVSRLHSDVPHTKNWQTAYNPYFSCNFFFKVISITLLCLINNKGEKIKPEKESLATHAS